MRFLPFTILFFSAITSCSDAPVDTQCEDFFDANEEIITEVWKWFPYENGEHTIAFTCESGSQCETTITRKENIIEDFVGPVVKCPEVSVSPRIEISSEFGDVEFEVYARDVILVGEKVNATLYFIIPDKGYAVSEVIDDLRTTGKTFEIGGTNYERVIKATFSSGSGVVKFVIYLQYEKGVLGYEKEGELFLNE